jgi:hypothetical protein
MQGRFGPWIRRLLPDEMDVWNAVGTEKEERAASGPPAGARHGPAGRSRHDQALALSFPV